MRVATARFLGAYLRGGAGGKRVEPDEEGDPGGYLPDFGHGPAPLDRRGLRLGISRVQHGYNPMASSSWVYQAPVAGSRNGKVLV